MKRLSILVVILVLIVIGVFVFLRGNNASKNAPISQSSAQSTSSIAFQGHVSRGEKFQKNIGNGLIFQLVPSDYGWNISIIPNTGKSDYDFTLATPPFHGINSTYMEGWHFRNASNTAANTGDVNAPQETRDFLFVLNNKDANTMAEAIWKLTSGKTLDFSPNVSLGKGELVVRNLKLGNLLAGKQAWIDSMDFTVTLSLFGGSY